MLGMFVLCATALLSNSMRSRPRQMPPPPKTFIGTIGMATSLSSTSPTSPRRNIELKARCPDLAAASRAARAIGARDAGLLVQTDSYFQVPRGRLKLRETDGKPAELIWYVRPNETSFRGSDYYVLPVPEPAATRAALSAALGLRGVVAKRRELMLWHNVRIHLDQVDRLGSFIEFEAVVGGDDADEATSHQRLAELARALHVRDEDRIAVSYSDLLGI